MKIQIEEVEKLLKPHLRNTFLITKRQDKKFGEIVAMLTTSENVSEIRHVCEQVLPKYWQPHSYIYVEKIPMTATGKPARKEAELIANR